MPNALYSQIIKLIEDGSVPPDDAVSNLERLLRLNQIDANHFAPDHIKQLRANLEGIIILRGDKTKLGAFKESITAIIGV